MTDHLKSLETTTIMLQQDAAELCVLMDRLTKQWECVADILYDVGATVEPRSQVGIYKGDL